MCGFNVRRYTLRPQRKTAEEPYTTIPEVALEDLGSSCSPNLTQGQVSENPKHKTLPKGWG